MRCLLLHREGEEDLFPLYLKKGNRHKGPVLGGYNCRWGNPQCLDMFSRSERESTQSLTGRGKKEGLGEDLM